MSSPEPRSHHIGPSGVLGVLDLAFGFFVWAAHFLLVYVGAAVACVLGLGRADPGSQDVFIAIMSALTVASAALVLGHALWRWRQWRSRPEAEFRRVATVGGDAIAALAILWQLYALLLVPTCV